MTRAQSLKILKAAGCSPEEAAAALASEDRREWWSIFTSPAEELTDEEYEREVEVSR